jgi:hypothetical protein
MKAGRLDGCRASRIVDATALLSDEDASTVEGQVVEQVEELSPAQLGRALNRAIRRLGADAFQERHEKRLAERRVDAYPTEDGCAAVTIHGSAERIQIADMRVDAIAKQLKASGAAAGRTLDQLRSDVALDLLAGKDYENAKVTVLVNHAGHHRARRGHQTGSPRRLWRYRRAAGGRPGPPVRRDVAANPDRAGDRPSA